MNTNKCRRNYSVTMLFGMALISLITQKVMYMQESLGTTELGYHQFLKPWFKTTVMFFAMMLSFFVFFINQCVNPKDTVNLSKYPIKTFFLTALPAIGDLLSTIMSTISMLSLGVSIVMILNGVKIIFSALISAHLKNQRILLFQWLGIFIMTAAITSVSIAAFFTQISIIINPSNLMIGISLLLKMVSQLIFCIKIAIEEHLTQTIAMDSTLIVAFEGLWGFLTCAVICLPAAHYIKGIEGGGFHEDFTDTILMIKNNKIILYLLFVEIAILLLFNLCSMTIIETTDAVMAVIFDLARTALIWLVQLIIYYICKGTSLDRYKFIGEEWTQWSWLQLFGFICLAIGILIFKGIIKLSCYDYSRLSHYDNYKKIETIEVETSV